MRRWIGLAAALYPREWRAEFGEEFRAVLDDVKPGWRVFGNVLRGAIEMRMVNGRNWTKVIAAMALAGALVGFAASYRVAPMYVSSAAIRVTPVADPLRPASAEVLRERALQHTQELQARLMSRAGLAAIINAPGLPLYRAELKNEPFEDVIDEMRRNIRMTRVTSSKSDPVPIVLSISFSYPDAPQAQAAVRLLVSKYLELNQRENQGRNRTYRDFWGDMASVEHLKPAPPAPVGEIADVLAAASLPVRMQPRYFEFLAWGFATGTLLGFLTVFVTRWPRHTKRVAAFAAAGLVSALVVSWLIPHRYKSTAIMMLQPAVLTENPLAAIPSPTSSAEFLRQVEPRILSTDSLAGVIQDPRLSLYRRERGTESIGEVVREMRANLSITPLNSGSAFSVSFTYPDRFKAQQTVVAMISRFYFLNQEKQRTAMRGMSFRQRAITERKAGEVLDVLDLPSLPVVAVFPNRWLFAAAGFGLGILIGAFTLRFRKPGTPAIARAQSLNVPESGVQNPAGYTPSALRRIVTA